MKRKELGVRRELLGRFDSIDAAAEAFWTRQSPCGSRIDVDPPTYSVSCSIEDELGQMLLFSEEALVVALKDGEYAVEYRPSKLHGVDISQRPPQPLLALRPEIEALHHNELTAETFEQLKFHFPGEAEAVVVAECLAQWSHNEAIFTELLKLFFRSPRWPIIALALLPEEVLLQNVEAEGCPLNDCVFSALYGESELFPVLYQCPPDFPEGLMPINQPIPDVELGKKLGWTYLGIEKLFATEDFSFIWFDIWGRNENLDDRAQLPVNFWRVKAEYV